MATQAALLYQEAPVGVFLPNSAEKPKPMPNSTSANRAAITTLIDVFLFSFSQPRSRHVGRQSVVIIVKRLQNSVFLSSTAVILSNCSNYPTVCNCFFVRWSDILLRSDIPPLQLCHYPAMLHIHWLNTEFLWCVIYGMLVSLWLFQRLLCDIYELW